MASYSLRFKRSVAKDLREIPKKDIERILERIESLAEDPRPRGDRTKRSEASLKQLLIEELPADNQERYRIRQGRYRILYEIEDDVLLVIAVNVAKRNEVY